MRVPIGIVELELWYVLRLPFALLHPLNSSFGLRFSAEQVMEAGRRENNPTDGPK
jgi:hypothetical protein